RLTFATPTIIAGDRSLVALIAHELAHSWSGNLVTNSTWDDFWLNEGFTVYFESRIMEEVYGADYSTMLTLLGQQDLEKTVEKIHAGKHPEDSKLILDLDGRNPDDGMTDIAYEKGRFFLKACENAVGRETWDAFLKQYFKEHAFGSMTTENFVEYINEHLIKGDQELAEKIMLDDWIYKQGLPSNFPKIQSNELDKVKEHIADFTSGKGAQSIDTANYTTHHWLYFLRNLPEELSPAQMQDLDNTFGFTNTGNSEILCEWFKKSVDNDYQPAFANMEAFLINVGRRKFLSPIYTKLARTPSGLELARNIFDQAKDGYHSVSRNSIQEILYPETEG
ncbi:MAG: aminopeptidase, partial [Bacteroidia bacterium]|nr:aminopeptidase [Bacteroidia bacterium]